jgi:hypothetical protein
MTAIKSGFAPIKDAPLVEYSKYFIVPGVWVNQDAEVKPIKCWGSFTPHKEYLGCFVNFLDAKEIVKHHKISKYFKK